MTAPAEPSPTIRAMIFDLVKRQAAFLFNSGLHSFRVAAVSGGRVELEPSGTRLFKAQRGVYQWPGVAGSESTPQVGSEVVLAFIDNDTSRPALVMFQPLRLTGGVPVGVKVDASGDIGIGASASSVTVGASTTVAGHLYVSDAGRFGGAGATPVAGSVTVDILMAALATTLTPIVAAFNATPAGTPMVSLGAGGVVPFVPVSTAVAKLSSV